MRNILCWRHAPLKFQEMVLSGPFFAHSDSKKLFWICSDNRISNECNGSRRLESFVYCEVMIRWIASIMSFFHLPERVPCRRWPEQCISLPGYYCFAVIFYVLPFLNDLEATPVPTPP